MLVAAGERHGLHIDARRLDGQAPDLFFGDPALDRAVDQPHPRIVQQARERHVLPDRQFQHQPGFLAVLRHQIDPLPDRVPRRHDTDRRVVDPDLATQQRVNAEGRTGKRGAASAHEPCQAEDLAAPHGKINLPVRKGGGHQVDDVAAARLRRPFRWRVLRLQVAADHQPDHCGMA